MVGVKSFLQQPISAHIAPAASQSQPPEHISKHLLASKTVMMSGWSFHLRPTLCYNITALFYHFLNFLTFFKLFKSHVYSQDKIREADITTSQMFLSLQGRKTGPKIQSNIKEFGTNIMGSDVSQSMPATKY